MCNGQMTLEQMGSVIQQVSNLSKVQTESKILIQLVDEMVTL